MQKSASATAAAHAKSAADAYDEKEGEGLRERLRGEEGELEELWRRRRRRRATKIWRDGEGRASVLVDPTRSEAERDGEGEGWMDGCKK